MKLTSFERTLCVVVLSSFAPLRAPNGLSIREGEVDWVSGVEKFLTSATQKARLGVRFAMLLFFAAPFWLHGQLRTLGGASLAERAEVMGLLLTHRILLVRELALLIKLCACMAMFRVSSLRARTGYDGPARPAHVLHTLHVRAA